jgi:hypothetical protein
VITFDDLTTTCGTGTWFSTMEVTIPALTPPGTYTVTISEVSLGGPLLGSYPWPLVVAAPTPTTTLLPDPTLPTVTLLPPSTTTTTDAVTTTTISATSTSAPSSLTTAAPARATTTTGRVVSTSSTTEADESGALLSSTGNDTTSTDPSLPTAAGEPNRIGEGAPFSEVAVTSGLIEVADRALPPVFAQAVLSPLVILEVLLRALARTTGGLLIPLGMTILAGFALARRLRRDAQELPELNDLVEIPEDDEEDDRS